MYKKIKNIALFDSIVFVLISLIYYFIICFLETDTHAHVRFIQGYLNGTNSFQVNFLFYFTAYFLSFCSDKTEYLLFSSYLILVFSTFLKFIISKRFLISENIKFNTNSKLISSFSAAILIFSFSLPSVLIVFGKFYALSYPLNVWHNSTTIFVMPFVVLLFWYSLKQIEFYKTKRDLILFLLIVLNIIIKPSFVFVYIVAYPLLMLKKHGFNRTFLKSLMPIFAAGIFILIEYYFIYIKQFSGFGNTSIKIDFMHIIYNSCRKNWINTVIIFVTTFVSSFLFPIGLLYRNKFLIKENMVQFALLCLAIGLVISSFLYETGKREFHGNFLWQNIMCSYLLFLVCLSQLQKLIAIRPIGWKAYKIEIGLLALHFVFGIVYLFKMFFTLSYI